MEDGSVFIKLRNAVDKLKEVKKQIEGNSCKTTHLSVEIQLSEQALKQLDEKEAEKCLFRLRINYENIL